VGPLATAARRRVPRATAACNTPHRRRWPSWLPTTEKYAGEFVARHEKVAVLALRPPLQTQRYMTWSTPARSRKPSAQPVQPSAQLDRRLRPNPVQQCRTTAVAAILDRLGAPAGSKTAIPRTERGMELAKTAGIASGAEDEAELRSGPGPVPRESIELLVRRYGSPLFVIDMAGSARKYRQLAAALRGWTSTKRPEAAADAARSSRPCPNEGRASARDHR